MSLIEIPTHWEVKNAVELFYIKGRIGWRGLKKADFTQEGPYLITGVDFANGKINWQNCVRIPMDKFLESPEIIIEKNDILLTKDGTVGKVAHIENIPGGKASLNAHIMLIRNQKNVNMHPRYVYYLLQSSYFHSFVTSIQKSWTRPSLPQKIFEKMPIPFPSYSEQQKIALKLDNIFEQLTEIKKEINENNNEIATNLEKIKLRLFRFVISKTIPYVKSNQLSKKPFSEVTKSFDNLRVPLNRSQRSVIQGMYPYYGASGKVDSINDYKFDGRFLLISEDGENLNSQKKPIAFVVEGKFWVNNHAHVVQTNNEVDLDYLCYYLNGLRIMNYAKKQATRPKLKKSDMDKIPIVFPKLYEQKIIVNNIQKMQKKVEVLVQNLSEVLQTNEVFLQEIDRLNLSILDRAFSGKLIN